jgi:hypothetical protein
VGELTFGEELGQGQTLGFGSKLEHDIALLAIYTPGVIDVREQVLVQIVHGDGKIGKHFIDYVTTEKNLRRTAVLVKPHHVSVRAKFQDTAKRVATAAMPSVVDRVVIATQRMLEPNLFARVQQFHSCRFAQPYFDRVMREVVQSFDGTRTIRDLLDLAGLGVDGFHAVVRMVRFGLLDAPEPGLLRLSSMIKRSEA